MMDKLKSAVMTRAMKLMTDPKVMKVLSNPKVTNLIMQGLTVKSRVEDLWCGRSEFLARQLNMATREEVDALRAELESLRDRLSSN